MRGDFQLVSFEPGNAIPDKNIIYQSTSQCSSVNFSTPLSELNRCLNYVDSQVLNIDLQGLGQTYSINIQGTGLTTDSLSSVTGFKDNKAEILDPDDIKSIFFEGREWKRHPRTFESLLSISLKGKDYDNLKISLSSMRPGRRYFVKSIWYE